ncbi:isopentenyl-diphosphate delta-isomerase [Amycolatopsis thailandensis]|uniref:Isopentenyl-diphosphate Delta-isomerase n=1 Tax=Amycolatopsis thailandensis TaxID=589330 RepID=A0A229RH56_9PSEU|nr:isopentenyl-diphosphate Delta-isomerase [Amycolatopsis thailandensis]OXM45983.1 isopentenyl-diphosphate delta-isomerase [Amycolatopsis thailandensis]
MTTPDDRTTGTEELVVLLDERFQPRATAPKRTVHTTDTPLHLAFSCYVFNGAGEVLVTRRALEKKTWPGVWTNSFCGHPAPGEDMADAVVRRGGQELGMAIGRLTKVLPRFRYQAVDVSGIKENEFCPVWTATADGEAHPNPDEVCESRWLPWPDLVAAMARAPFLFSPWSQEQVPLLAEALRP